MYFPQDIFNNIMSYLPKRDKIIHPVAKLFKNYLKFLLNNVVGIRGHPEPYFPWVSIFKLYKFYNFRVKNYLVDDYDDRRYYSKQSIKNINVRCICNWNEISGKNLRRHQKSKCHQAKVKKINDKLNQGIITIF